MDFDPTSPTTPWLIVVFSFVQDILLEKQRSSLENSINYCINFNKMK